MLGACATHRSATIYRDDDCDGLYRNSNLYPTVILLGNFLVPIVFVAFLYNHRPIAADV